MEFVLDQVSQWVPSCFTRVTTASPSRALPRDLASLPASGRAPSPSVSLPPGPSVSAVSRFPCLSSQHTFVQGEAPFVSLCRGVQSSVSNQLQYILQLTVQVQLYYPFFADVFCNDPGYVENSVRVPQSGAFRCGDSVTYSCNFNYQMVGSSRLTCGSTGNWDAFLPQCIQNCKYLLFITGN